MNLIELMEEAALLTRECLWAVPAGSESNNAAWGGQTGEAEILLTIDASLLPGNREGILQLSRKPTGEYQCGIIVGSWSATSIPLLASRLNLVRHSSLPPLDALFALGSRRIGDWLIENDWPREELFNNNFPDVVAKEYESIWMAQCPLYVNEQVFAQVGGWNMVWPDGDFHSRLHSGSQLLVWTLEYAEPWLEIWESESSLQIIERIT